MALGSIPAGEASHSPRASRHRQGGEQNSWCREEGAPAAGESSALALPARGAGRPFCGGAAPAALHTSPFVTLRECHRDGKAGLRGFQQLAGGPHRECIWTGVCCKDPAPTLQFLLGRTFILLSPRPRFYPERLPPGRRHRWAFPALRARAARGPRRAFRWLFGAEGSSCRLRCPRSWPGDGGSRKVPSSEGSRSPPAPAGAQITRAKPQPSSTGRCAASRPRQRPPAA